MVTMDNAFIWDDSFITGFDHVDQQHHVLVDLFNELNQAVLAPAATAMVCWPMCMAASWPTPNTTSAKKKS